VAYGFIRAAVYETAAGIYIFERKSAGLAHAEARADQVIQLRQAARLEAEALDERAAIWMFGPGRVSSGQGQASAAVRAREIDRGFATLLLNGK
jgi:hypothetical protein